LKVGQVAAVIEKKGVGKKGRMYFFAEYNHYLTTIDENYLAEKNNIT
jgi:hypothetical protein